MGVIEQTTSICQSNIICNNCVGARIYEVSGMQFPNPFMWISTHVDDFIKLTNNFYKLDFDDAVITLERFLQNTYDTVLVTLPFDIKLHFIHYIQDNTKDSPTKENNTNIRSNNILQYAITKWQSRSKRMSCEPIFLFSMNPYTPGSDAYQQILDKLFHIQSTKLIILLHASAEISNIVPPNIRILRCADETMKAGGSLLAKTIKDEVFNLEQELRTPFLIGTRLFSTSYGRTDAVERSNNRDCIHHCSKVAIQTMVPSLLNQCYQDFQHFTIINDQSNRQLMEDYRTTLERQGFHTTLVTPEEWQQVINSNSKRGSVIVARMDLDDAVKSTAVKEIRSAFEFGKTQIVGYRNGLIVWENSDELRCFHYDLNTGHIAIMQAVVADTAKEDVHPKFLNIYSYKHTNPEELINFRHLKIQVRCLDDKEDISYAYIRHKDADSFRIYKPQNFKLVEYSKDNLKANMGLHLPLKFDGGE